MIGRGRVVMIVVVVHPLLQGLLSCPSRLCRKGMLLIMLGGHVFTRMEFSPRTHMCVYVHTRIHRAASLQWDRST